MCAVVEVGCGSSSKTSTPPATKTTYTGTIYMASQGGGHVAVVPVTIDPSNATSPITTGTITKIQLSTDSSTGGPLTGANNKTHVFHDVRLDGTKLYYSAIFSDTTGTNNGMVHLGYVDLAASNAVHDAMIDATANATAPMMAYCGSGQTADYFIPMTMSSPAYIDVIPKTAISTGTISSSTTTGMKRTTVESFRTGGDANYKFVHGVNNPNHSQLFVAVNETTAGSMNGSVTGYLMDMNKIVAGTVTSSDVTKNTITGLSTGGGTVAFRSTFTPDGLKILQAGKDRLLVLDGSSLTVLDNNTAIGGTFAANTANGGIENHDVIPTPDGKYAILALRFQPTNSVKQDSGLQLYDLAAKKTVGDPVSTCSGCHAATATVGHVTCGIDAMWK